MNKPHTLIAATYAGFPLFVTHEGMADAFRQISDHLSTADHRPGYEFSLFHVLDVSDMSLHSVRLSNRPDAAERPYLVSHAFLVSGPGSQRESARFCFSGLLMIFRSGDEAVGCEVFQDGKEKAVLAPADAVESLKWLLSQEGA